MRYSVPSDRHRWPRQMAVDSVNAASTEARGTALSRLKEFDLLKPSTRARVTIRPVWLSEIPALLALAEQLMPVPITSSPLAREALRRNRHNVHLFLRDDRMVGFMALLMLRSRGLRALLASKLDCLDPDPVNLTTTAETPAAIYSWALVAPGRAVEGVNHIAHLLSQPRFRRADIYARPLSKAARRLQLNHGFEPLENSPLDLHRYVRLANRMKPCMQPEGE